MFQLTIGDFVLLQRPDGSFYIERYDSEGLRISVKELEKMLSELWESKF